MTEVWIGFYFSLYFSFSFLQFSDHYNQNLREGKLVIEPVQLEDQGYYRCMANTSGQQLVYSKQAVLEVTREFWS